MLLNDVADVTVVQPVVVGGVDDSVTCQPVTPTVSLAVKLLIATVRLDAVAGKVKADTVGGVVSGSVIVQARPV